MSGLGALGLMLASAFLPTLVERLTGEGRKKRRRKDRRQMIEDSIRDYKYADTELQGIRERRRRESMDAIKNIWHSDNFEPPNWRQWREQKKSTPATSFLGGDDS